MTANRFLPSRYDENVHHLTFGIEPIDALRGTRAATPVDVTFDDPDRDARHRLERHPSLVYVLRYEKRVRAPFRVRIVDEARCFVPRRLTYHIAAPPPPDLGALVRVGHPRLFPGAGYPVTGSATGVRGRVVWRTTGPNGSDRPIPWVRVEATVKGVSVAWAHGDDRGEFLLLLPPAASHEITELDASLTIAGTITVFAPATAPAPPPVPQMHAPAPDPLEHLWVEQVPDGDEDIPPDRLPWLLGKHVTQPASFRLGRLLTLQDPFVFQP